MQKEKQVKSYQRRTKSGKVVSVKAHTAKYTAAEEKAKESARSKKGSGEELEKLKEAKALSEKDLGFSMEDFAEWYNGTGSEVDKRVEKVLKKHLGKDGYKELNNYAADNYKRGGHKSMFKNLGDHFDRLKPKAAGSKETKVQKDASLGLPKVGEKVKLANWMDHSQKKSSFEVIGVQKATKADKEADISNWLWVKDSKGKVYAATQTADGKIGVDTTWTNFTDKKKHPYEKSLKDAGYSLSKDKGYWEVSSKDAKSKPSKNTSKADDDMKDLGMKVNKRGEIVWTSDKKKHPEKYKDAWEKEVSKIKKTSAKDNSSALKALDDIPAGDMKKYLEGKLPLNARVSKKVDSIVKKYLGSEGFSNWAYYTDETNNYGKNLKDFKRILDRFKSGKGTKDLQKALGSHPILEVDSKTKKERVTTAKELRKEAKGSKSKASSTDLYGEE